MSDAEVRKLVDEKQWAVLLNHDQVRVICIGFRLLLSLSLLLELVGSTGTSQVID